MRRKLITKVSHLSEKPFTQLTHRLCSESQAGFAIGFVLMMVLDVVMG